MSWSIINLISESYFLSYFLAPIFCIGMSFILWFCCKRQTGGTTLGSSLAQPWAGGPLRSDLGTRGRAELPLHCARARVCPVSLSVSCHQEGLPAQSHALESHTFTYLFPTNSRKLITFDTISVFPSFFPFLIR